MDQSEWMIQKMVDGRKSLKVYLKDCLVSLCTL